MRTVDPEIWFKKVKRRRMDLARPLKFGQKRLGLEARLRDSLNDAMEEFWGNCSMEGVKHLVSEHTGKWERYLWLLMLTSSVFCGVLVASLDLSKFTAQSPLHVSLQSAQHSVRHLPFPAIALCSYNVISQRALEKLTMLLVARDQNGTYSPAAIRQNLLTFGSLLTLSLPLLDLQFMPYLSGTSTSFNITNLMFLLAPSCDSMLVKCTWRGRETPCNRLFAARLTSVGYCCVFNARYDQEDVNNPPKVLDVVGSNDGLSVVLKEDADDFTFLRRPVIGTEVLIFDGREYPLLEGGAVRVHLARRNASVFFALSIREQIPSPSLAYYTESWRGCRLRSPGPESGLRSYAWCLAECRRRAALQLCGCAPYTLQPRADPTCSLNHLSCLNKHREKFLYYFPAGYALESLSEESQNALVCQDCRADCARPIFSAAVSHVEITRPEKLLRNRFTAGVNLVNATVMRFFYATEDQHLYAVEGNSNWYETFASISCYWVAVLGVTLVTFFELIFHCTIRWRHHYVRRKTMYTTLATPSDIY